MIHSSSINAKHYNKNTKKAAIKYTTNSQA